ncbi:MAG: hypothetical protein ABIM89_14510 [Mycobacteriales bacterium]
MNDLETMLSDVGRAHSPQPLPDGVIDGDVARGRRALARRRMRQSATRLVVVVALSAGAFVVVAPQGGNAPDTVASPPVTRLDTSVPAPVVAAPAIKLVAYTGEQPAGYTVGTVPAGWEIQGVDNYALVIARRGDPDQEVGSFVGKLVVMLQSKDEGDRTDGTEVSVGSTTGRIVRGDPAMASDGTITPGDMDAARLFFKDSAGHRLVIQAPVALHWSDAQIVEFGESVHANENAEAGVG